MTKQTVYAARTEKEPYLITQAQKDAAAERRAKQRKAKGKTTVKHDQ